MPAPWDVRPANLRRGGEDLHFVVPTQTETVIVSRTHNVARAAATDESEVILFLPPNAAHASLTSPSFSSSPATTRAPTSPIISSADPVAIPTSSVSVAPPPVDANLGASNNTSTNASASQPSSTGPVATPTASSDAGHAPLVMAYYPDWAGRDYPPEKIDFGRFDWIDFAFAVPDQNMNLGWDGSDDAPDLLRRVVARAHESGKHAKLSVGGWTGSKSFSSAVGTPENRATLANNILTLYQQYGLDGIDLDWEYPGQSGNSGNGVSPADSANFLEFLRVLRDTLPPGAKITAATQTVPFAGADGSPLRDVSDFARVLDWVLIMNYDSWGSSDQPGPNAPLSDACSNSTQPGASALAALRAWTAAGFPASQLVLGVPSYGYLSRSSATRLRTRAGGTRASPRVYRSGRLAENGRRRREQRQGQGQKRSMQRFVWDWIDSLLGPPVYDTDKSGLLVNEDGGTDDGQVQFRELVRQGALAPYSSSPGAPAITTNSSSAPASADGTPQSATPAYDGTFGGEDAALLRAAIEDREPRSLFAGAHGFVREWDGCSSTPFLRAGDARQVVAYDDPVSLEMKGQLVRQARMLGVNMFDVTGDTDGWDLTDALRRGLGVV
ncbi:glycoside hydrolase [Dichomitus squalens LYAD-421 SS1]|uniref:Glycoside hydrolase n=1 Tax=Dichomitus squalens (strain LYAD-421) TaxID=732165 RepID=R7SYN8_DICSQ|nr:glycoside hydrolase [Dichomitus squalens LYAD-421 SS1]EJF61166.1 glycoside hydrolase [Dichomitus squalens LYAD-421 SS1]